MIHQFWKNPDVGARWSTQHSTYGTKRPRRRATKSFIRPVFAWNRRVLLQRLQLHLYTPQIIEPKPKGRQPHLAFALLFAAIVLSVRKSRHPPSDISIISPLWLALEAWGESAGISLDSFGLLRTASWRDIKRKLHWFFFLPPRPLLFWLLLNFWAGSQQGVLPVGAVSIVPLKTERVKTDCFKWKWGRGTSPKKKVYRNFFLSLFLERCFRATFLCFVRSLVCFSTKRPCQFCCRRRLRSVN